MTTRYIAYLPPERQTTCPSCEGSGQVMMERDLHRSAGIIPCPNHHCAGGRIISEAIPSEEYEARRLAGTLYSPTRG